MCRPTDGQLVGAEGRIRRTGFTTIAMGTSAVFLALIMAACAEREAPTEPEDAAARFNHHSAAHDEKGYIRGWFRGSDVQLHYTKSFFCSEPPASGAATQCVLNAQPEVFPRPGELPRIYAIAPVGFIPDLATLSCAPGSVCLNHPAMIDASRLGNPAATNVPAVPHSHIIDEHAAGWWQTVNIRVFSLAVWNDIAAAKSLERVRQLQMDPEVGGKNLISQDTPTNIFFFIQPQK